MSLRGLRVAAEAIRRLGFADIGADYAPIGTGFAHESRITIIQNFTDALLTFSLDGVTDWQDIPAGGAAILDWCSNKTIQSEAFVIGAGDVIWVKEGPDAIAPTLGRVNVSMVYGAV